MNRTSGKSRLRRRPRRRGVSAVEFALVLPVLVTLVWGAVDFGRCFYSYIAVTNAARAGAEYASTHPVTTKTQAVWQNGIAAAIASELGGEFPQPQTDLPSSDENGMKMVSVTATYQFKLVVKWLSLTKDLPITRTVTMRVIRY